MRMTEWRYDRGDQNDDIGGGPEESAVQEQIESK